MTALPLFVKTIRSFAWLLSIFAGVVWIQFPRFGFAAPVPERGAIALHSMPEARFAFEGVVGGRIRANIDGWLIPAPGANPGMIEMFRMRDRQPPPKLVDWAGEFAGKYLISAVQTLRLSDRVDLRDRVRSFVSELLSTQAEDGYLGPFPRAERLRGHWDLWGHYHVMQGLLLWHEQARDAAAFEAVRHAADLICDTYLDQPRRVFDAGSHEMNMAIHHLLAELHRITGETRYERLAREIEKDWERAGDYLRTGLAGVEFHATPRPRWESLHSLQGLFARWRATGDVRYRQAFEHHWRSILRGDVHNAGSFSSGEQATGNPWAPGAIETCCTIAWMALSVDMLRLTGDPRIADELERSTLNGALGAQHPSGRWWTYNTPMDGVREASAHSIVFQARAGAPELNCCSVNGPRALGMLSEWAVMRGANGFVVNWHGPVRAHLVTADGAALRLRSESELPRSGQVRWVVEHDRAEARPISIRWRVPGWSKTTTVRLNKKEPQTVEAGTYFEIARDWKSGDAVEFSFDMALRAVAGEREARGKVSLFRGPLLLAWDQRHNGVDEPQIPRIDPQQLDAATLVGSRNETGVPWLLLDLPAARGATLRLCDYASAGASGTRYRSWLKTTLLTAETTDAAPVAPDGVFVKAALRGDPRPEHGRLRKAAGATAVAGASGRPATALRLDGAGGMLVYALPLEFGGDFSVALRVRVNALPKATLGQIFSAWAGPMDDPVRLTIEKGKVHARIEAGSAYSTSGHPVEIGNWMHMAAVKAGGRLTLFVDGQPRGAVDVPFIVETAAQTCALGGNPNFSGAEFVAADFADFVGYNRALSAAEVIALSKGVE